MLAVLLTLAAQSPDLAKPITLRTVAKPVAEILRDVSAQAGFTFVAEQVRDWPVIVSVKDLPVGQVLDRIAEVTDAEWRKEAKQWTLERSPARVKKAVDLELADRAARLKPVVDALPTEMSDEEFEKAIAEVNQRVREMAEQSGEPSALVGGPSPCVVLLSAILRGMPIEELAEAPISSFISYSTDPQPGQRRLAPIPTSSWSAYRATRDRFAKRLDIPPHLLFVAGLSKAELPNKPKVTLTLARPNATANVHAAVNVFAADGQLLDRSLRTLAPVPLPVSALEPPTSERIRLSASGQTLLRALRRQNPASRARVASMSGDHVPVYAPDPWTTPENVAIARAAVESEPMAYAISDWLLDLGDRTERPMVAHVPDHAYHTLTERLGASADHAAMWRTMPEVGLDRVLTDKVLIVKPLRFARADRYRVDRPALRKLVRAGGRYGKPSLADLLEYAGSSPAIPYLTNLDTTLLELIFRRAFGRVLGSHDHVSALRLMREFRAQSNEDRLRIGEAKLRFGRAYDVFLRAAYAEHASWEMVRGRAVLPAEWEFDPFAHREVDPETPVIMDPSYKVDGVLLILEGDEAAALSPGGLGTFLGLRPENFTGFQPLLRIVKLHPATFTRHEVMFRAGAWGVIVDVEDILARLNEELTVDQLPAAWRQQIEDGRAQGAMIRIGVGRQPPPP